MLSDPPRSPFSPARVLAPSPCFLCAVVDYKGGEERGGGGGGVSQSDLSTPVDDTTMIIATDTTTITSNNNNNNDSSSSSSSKSSNTPSDPPTHHTDHYILTAHSVRENLRRLLRAMQLPRPILLEGPPGVGKTSIISNLAKLTGHTLVRTILYPYPTIPYPILLCSVVS